jgi:hypothetical integral membrane protein (TIGR02206 family)
MNLQGILGYNFPTMLERYFSRFWFGVPFEMFNPPHSLSLVIILFLSLWLIAMRKRFNIKTRKAVRIILSILLLASQFSFILWLVYLREASFATALPLHLCSLFILLSAIMLLTRSYRIFEYSYFLGTGGAIFALITPDIGMYNFPHFLPIQTMIAHGSLLLAQIYMTSVEGFRPTLKSLFKVYGSVLLYASLVVIINALTHANYLFFSYKPDFPTLLDYLGPWPWYIPAALAVGALVCALLYLPFHQPAGRITMKWSD